MFNPYEDTYLNEYNDLTFSDVFSPNESGVCDYDTFKAYYDDMMPLIKTNCLLEEEYIRRTFYLLYTKYGNSKAVGSGYDTFQWRLKLFSIMSESGEVWQQKSKIQDYLRGVDIATNTEILTGNKNIINTALNPNSKPTTNSIQELEFISQQHTTGKKKGKLEALFDLKAMLNENVNSTYLRKFSDLFSKVALNDVYNHTYISEEN